MVKSHKKPLNSNVNPFIRKVSLKVFPLCLCNFWFVTLSLLTKCGQSCVNFKVITCNYSYRVWISLSYDIWHLPSIEVVYNVTRDEKVSTFFFCWVYILFLPFSFETATIRTYQSHNYRNALRLLDRLQRKALCLLKIDDPSKVDIHPLEHRRKVASLSTFYRNSFLQPSLELTGILPSAVTARKQLSNYSRIFQNILEYSRIFPNICEYFWLFLNTLKYFVTFWNILEYSRIKWNNNDLEYSIISWSILEHSIIFQNIPEYSHWKVVLERYCSRWETRSFTSYHPFAATIPKSNTMLHLSSYIPRSSHLWNSLPLYFPLSPTWPHSSQP